MTRRDPNANNGLLNWPVGYPGMHDSGEGGMTVYALWPERPQEHAAPGWNQGAFYNCFPGFHLKANVCESPVSDISEVRDHLLYAAVCLGTSGGSWTDEEGEFWEATLSDVTDAGLNLITELNFLYQQDAVLVTVVDT